MLENYISKNQNVTWLPNFPSRQICNYGIRVCTKQKETKTYPFYNRKEDNII